MTGTRDFSWADIVARAEGDDLNVKECAYEFSNGRKFYSTDKTSHGFYHGGAVTAYGGAWGHSFGRAWGESFG